MKSGQQSEFKTEIEYCKLEIIENQRWIEIKFQSNAMSFFFLKKHPSGHRELMNQKS